MLSVATDVQAQDELRLDLDQLVREGAQRMLAAVLEAEVDATWPCTPPTRVDDRRTDLVTGRGAGAVVPARAVDRRLRAGAQFDKGVMAERPDEVGEVAA